MAAVRIIITLTLTNPHTNAIVRRPSVERSRSDGRLTDLSFRMSVPTGFRQGLFNASDILGCMSRLVWVKVQTRNQHPDIRHPHLAQSAKVCENPTGI